ncbi:MAG: YfjI family protein [Steroidobacteraceae bacterium]
MTSESIAGPPGGSQPDELGFFWRDTQTVLDNGFVIKWESPVALRTIEYNDDYPVDSLPEIIKDAVLEVQTDGQAPAALVAGCALSVVSTVVQSIADVERKPGLVGPVSLYLFTIARSGERKSTCDNKFRPIISKWETWQAELLKPQLADFEARKKAWEAVESGYNDAIRKAAREGKSADTIQHLLSNHMLNQPVKPRVPRVLRGDDTPEALAVALQDYPIASVISAEAGVIFGSVGMNADTVMRNLAQANTFWDGAPFKRDRTTQKSVNIETMRVTMGLQVQPAVIENFMSKLGKLAQGIGYFSRFLLCEPESTQGSRIYKETAPGQPALEAFTNRAAQILRIPVSFDATGKLVTTVLTFSDEAKEQWVNFYNDVETSLGVGKEFYAVQDVASKIAEQAARIAGCFHVFDWSAGCLISGDHMQRAVRLAWWYLKEAMRYCKMNTIPEVMRNADTLEEWLVNKRIAKKLFRNRVAQIQRAGPSCIRERKDLDAALDLLEAHNRIRVIGTGERTKFVYVNPDVLKEWL